jgi:CBS domain-containing protein
MTTRRMSDFVRSQRPTVTLPSSASVKKACQAMRDHRIGAVLVTGRDGGLVGIFTGRDAVCRVLAAGRDGATMRLEEVMTAEPMTMPPGATAIDALHAMKDGNFRHLPVVEHGRIAGIVSHGDFRGIELDRLDEETGIWERR